MGFDDREMVALSGAHSLGRAHTDRSGYDGPWDFSPTVFSNEFFRLLVDEKWGWKKVSLCILVESLDLETNIS
jgi:cytochrome c peroxidase